jgi:hypothetical protein
MSTHVPAVVLIQKTDFFSWSLAESDATKALEIDPKSIKVLYRRAITRREQRNFVGVWEGWCICLCLPPYPFGTAV